MYVRAHVHPLVDEETGRATPAARAAHILTTPAARDRERVV